MSTSVLSRSVFEVLKEYCGFSDREVKKIAIEVEVDIPNSNLSTMLGAISLAFVRQAIAHSTRELSFLIMKWRGQSRKEGYGNLYRMCLGNLRPGEEYC